MSFASEPGRDDGSLPPVNIEIPDDARELERDMLAYRREVRARRRRERLLRLLRPVNRTGRISGHVAIMPLIALCLVLSLVGGALLSVATISPAAAPTLDGPQAYAPTILPNGLTALPAGSVRLAGHGVPVRSLGSSAIALVPAHCACGVRLQRLANQAAAAHVRLYFIGTGTTMTRLTALASRYGDGFAVTAADSDGVLRAAYRPFGLTVLLVFHDATAEVHRNLSATFQFGPTLKELTMAGDSRPAG